MSRQPPRHRRYACCVRSELYTERDTGKTGGKVVIDSSLNRYVSMKKKTTSFVYHTVSTAVTTIGPIAEYDVYHDTGCTQRQHPSRDRVIIR